MVSKQRSTRSALRVPSVRAHVAARTHYAASARALQSARRRRGPRRAASSVLLPRGTLLPVGDRNAGSTASRGRAVARRVSAFGSAGWSVTGGRRAMGVDAVSRTRIAHSRSPPNNSTSVYALLEVWAVLSVVVPITWRSSSSQPHEEHVVRAAKAAHTTAKNSPDGARSRNDRWLVRSDWCGWVEKPWSIWKVEDARCKATVPSSVRSTDMHACCYCLRMLS